MFLVVHTLLGVSCILMNLEISCDLYFLMVKFDLSLYPHIFFAGPLQFVCFLYLTICLVIHNETTIH